MLSTLALTLVAVGAAVAVGLGGRVAWGITTNGWVGVGTGVGVLAANGAKREQLNMVTNTVRDNRTFLIAVYGGVIFYSPDQPVTGREAFIPQFTDIVNEHNSTF
jgi:hypothetical protein